MAIKDQADALVASVRSFVDRRVAAEFRVPTDAALVERVVDERVKGATDSLQQLSASALTHDGRLLEIEARLDGFVREMHAWREAIDERLKDRR